jgi:hypothetical protein
VSDTLLAERIREYRRLMPCSVEASSARSQAMTVPGDGALPDGMDSGIALEGRLGQAYTERAFRHLLAIERTRSEKSGRPFGLLLVDVRAQLGGPSARLHPIVARELFEGLWSCLRDTDFIGWYRADTVVGAVLTEPADGPDTVAFDNVAARMSRLLSQHLPSGIASRVRLRLQLHGAPQAAGAHHLTRGLG